MIDIRRLMKLEWLEADGNGGFASGTVAGIRTRRYHAWLLAATMPPTGRMVLVNGAEVWAHTRVGSFPLSSHHYTPDVVHPDGVHRIVSFKHEPWPRWRFRLDDGSEIEQELFVPHGLPVVVVCWRLVKSRRDIRLSARPLLSGRDYHALHRENPGFRFKAEIAGPRVTWHPYDGVPAVTAIANATYVHDPQWYRHFFYREERERGLDDTEDLASPGVFEWNLSAGDARLVLAADADRLMLPGLRDAEASADTFKAGEQERRRRFPSALHRAADSYLVHSNRRTTRGHGQSPPGLTILAGYPWFTDWGRDTFIALRGLCLATGRYEAARRILVEWAGAVSEGMLPNRFLDTGTAVEYNSVDASLWYLVAAYEWLQGPHEVGDHDRSVMLEAVDAVITGYTKGTRYRIHADDDGLLAAGTPGMQLTWMDAKVGDQVITPRIGKPVEVQALWINALWMGTRLTGSRGDLLARARTSFTERFWNDRTGCLYDVIDCEHRLGAVDPTIRPNQIFAVGGLPLPIVTGARARQIVDLVEERLWTPLGLRSLALGETGYVGHYGGGVQERDGAYHQGTVWPWLAGPFVEAWIRTHGNDARARTSARQRFLPGLLAHLNEAGLGHVSEIADAEPPFTPRGCPFQAWSLGELLRLYYVTLSHGFTTHRERRPVPKAKGHDDE